MKTKFAWLTPFLFSAAFVIAGMTGHARAQHLEIGGFGEYENVNVPGLPSSAFGLGGRLDIGLHRLFQAEFETAYDFKHPEFTLNNAVTAGVLTQSKVGILHANAGFKIQSPGGSFFLFVKGGVNRYDPELTTTAIGGSPFGISTITTPQNSFTQGIFYPGGGLGFHAGPLGIRLDAGDEIYWANGAHNNFRVTFGPTFRL
jgi:hypothetical protein